jgi:hypothetical protein
MPKTLLTPLGALTLLSLTACGGSATTTPTPPPPAIANLSAGFLAATCIRAADGLPGRALAITFDFSESAGTISGGHVQLTRVYDTGRSETHQFAVPAEVTVSGTVASGQIRIGNACPLYNDATASTERLTLVDASGATSNTLSTTVSRPAGAP